LGASSLEGGLYLFLEEFLGLRSVCFTSGVPSKIMSNYMLIKGLSILGVRAGETVRRRSPELGQDYAVELPRLAAPGVMRPHISYRFPMSERPRRFSCCSTARWSARP
jgi:hypothetical protein